MTDCYDFKRFGPKALTPEEYHDKTEKAKVAAECAINLLKTETTVIVITNDLFDANAVKERVKNLSPTRIETVGPNHTDTVDCLVYTNDPQANGRRARDHSKNLVTVIPANEEQDTHGLQARAVVFAADTVNKIMFLQCFYPLMCMARQTAMFVDGVLDKDIATSTFINKLKFIV
jgi:hypothetical protein